ncbi:MAG: DUF202 domain-containing protein, partial [Micromonosporaceae bacterium]
RLAWRRTVLTATVVALLAVRAGLLADSPGVRGAATALAMLLWLLVLVVAARRIAAVSRPAALVPLTDTGPTAMLTVATVIGLAAVGFALVLT